MVKNEPLMILGLGLLAIWFLKNQSSATPNDTGSSSPFLITSQTKPADIPQAKSTVDSSGQLTGSVMTASKATLSTIQKTASENPDKVLYYSDYGIVTAGGQGYSTAFPQNYLSKTTIAPTVSKTASTPSNTQNNLLNAFNTNPFTGKAYI